MAQGDDEQPILDWRIDVGLITEPLLLVAYVKMLALAALLMGGLLSFLAAVSGNLEGIPAMLALTGVALGVVALIGLFVMTVILRNRFSMRFIVDERGVRQLSTDRRAKTGGDAAAAIGALAGSSGATGAGLIAQSQADREAAWEGIVTVRHHPARRAIALANSWRTVMLIFCLPENYEAVAARVAAQTNRPRTRRKPRANPLPGLLLKSVIVIAACLPFFVLPYPFELDLFAPLLTLAFALSAVWLVPMLGMVALGGLGFMWFEIFLRAEGVLRASRPDLWGPLAIAAAATAALVALLAGLMRGVYASGLVADEAELDFPSGDEAKQNEDGQGEPH